MIQFGQLLLGFVRAEIDPLDVGLSQLAFDVLFSPIVTGFHLLRIPVALRVMPRA